MGGTRYIQYRPSTIYKSKKSIRVPPRFLRRCTLSPLLRIIDLYANQPLDNHAHHLLKMVQYNGNFPLLYEPDFVIFRHCQNADDRAE